MKKNHEINFTEGRILPKILLFTLPLILSGILQLFYNAADTVIVGRYAGKLYLAAVGATGTFNSLIINLFLGLSVGANVMASRFFGSKDSDGFSTVMHTSVMLSLIIGLFLAVFGQLIVAPVLSAMGTPNDIIAYSVKYMRIIFLGMPATVLYNFGASILRAVGDTKRPLYILSFSGIINVVLNLFFVIKLNMNVTGVATATTVSQYISALLIIVSLSSLDEMPGFSFKKLHINSGCLSNIVKIGLPSGINSSVFSLSNVLIQSAVNTFGSDVVAGNSVGMSLEGFIYVSMNAYYLAVITYMGQNHGAGKIRRLNLGLIINIICVTVTGFGFGMLFFVFRHALAGIYNSDYKVIEYAAYRNSIILPTYFLCGVMDVIVGAMRGIGKSVEPMIISLVTVCGLRMAYVLFVFPHLRSLFLLYASWPATWIICIIFQSILYTHFIRKIKAETVKI